MNWNEKQRLINVTAIQSNGSPITTQMWDASMDDVEKRVMVWHADSFNESIIRVFVCVPGAYDEQERTYEYQVQDKNGIVGSFGERHRSFTGLVRETTINHS